MAITSVSKQEFEQVKQGHGTVLSEESKAVLALDVGQAIKFPCRWNHKSPRFVCFAGGMVRLTAKRHSKK